MNKKTYKRVDMQFANYYEMLIIKVDLGYIGEEKFSRLNKKLGEWWYRLEAMYRI